MLLRGVHVRYILCSSALESVEVTRNPISDVGGRALLFALLNSATLQSIGALNTLPFTPDLCTEIRAAQAHKLVAMVACVSGRLRR